MAAFAGDSAKTSAAGGSAAAPVGLTAATRRCDSCAAARPPEHSYCYVCGRRLGPAVVPANTRRFRQRGLSLTAGRIATRQDRFGEPPRRTWGDMVARWYLSLTLLVAVALWASSRGWLPAAWWEQTQALALRTLGG